MFDRVTVLETIDRAVAAQRLCAACGAPTVVRTDGDLVYLECSDIDGAGFLRRIEDLLMPHTRRVVLDFGAGLAA
jgi:hypothetical protein